MPNLQKSISILATVPCITCSLSKVKMLIQETFLVSTVMVGKCVLYKVICLCFLSEEITVPVVDKCPLFRGVHQQRLDCTVFGPFVLDLVRLNLNTKYRNICHMKVSVTIMLFWDELSKQIEHSDTGVNIDHVTQLGRIVTAILQHRTNKTSIVTGDDTDTLILLCYFVKSKVKLGSYYYMHIKPMRHCQSHYFIMIDINDTDVHFIRLCIFEQTKQLFIIPNDQTANHDSSSQ